MALSIQHWNYGNIGIVKCFFFLILVLHAFHVKTDKNGKVILSYYLLIIQSVKMVSYKVWRLVDGYHVIIFC